MPFFITNGSCASSGNQVYRRYESDSPNPRYQKEGRLAGIGFCGQQINLRYDQNQNLRQVQSDFMTVQQQFSPTGQLVEKIFSSMQDEQMIDFIDSLGLDQPVIDEKYEQDLSIDVFDEYNSGITLSFSEPDGSHGNDIPCLTVLEMHPHGKLGLPFSLSESDGYKACVEKLGRKADFISKVAKKIEYEF